MKPKSKLTFPNFNIVAFGDLGEILIDLGEILIDLGQMFRTIWGQTCSERSEHEHCSGPTQVEGEWQGLSGSAMVPANGHDDADHSDSLLHQHDLTVEVGDLVFYGP